MNTNYGGWWCLALLAGLCGGCSTTTPVAPAVVEFAAAAANEAPQYAVSTRSDRVGHIMVPVSLNEQGPFHFMLDTGATATVMTSATARQLQLTTNGTRPVIVHGISGSGVFPTVMLQAFAAGSLQFPNLKIPVMNGAVRKGIDGILGTDGLMNKTVTADFAHDSVRIAESTGRPARGRYAVLPFTFTAKRLPLISVEVGPMRVKAVIDTGAMQTLGNSALLNALAAQGIEPSRQLRVIDATQTSQAGALALVPKIRLGEVAVLGLEVTFADFKIFDYWGLNDEPALLIGMDVLGIFDELAIDYRRRELHLLPPSA